MSFGSWEIILWVIMIGSFAGTVVSTIILIWGLVGEYKDPHSSVMIEIGFGILKKFPSLVIIGVAGELFFNTVTFVSSVVLDVWHSDEVVKAQTIASAAYKVDNEAKVRAETLALEVEVLRGKNDQFELENQLRQKEIDSNQKTLTKDIKQTTSTLQAVEGRERPRPISEFDLQKYTKGIGSSLRTVTLIRLSDPIAGTYATNLGKALQQLKPKFAVSFIELPASRFSGVIVCQNGGDDLKVGKALKDANIATDIKPIMALECTQPIPPTVSPGVFGIPGSSQPKPVGTLIFVGHRRLPPP